MIDLWFTEKHSEGAKFSILVKKHLYSAKSPFQQIDFFESEEFGKFFTLDGIMMANEKDEFIYHEMLVHVPMAVRIPAGQRSARVVVLTDPTDGEVKIAIRATLRGVGPRLASLQVLPENTAISR